MPIDMSGFREFFGLLYSDEMDVTTTEEDTSRDTSNAVYPDTPQQTNVPCRISFSNKDQAKDATETHERVALQPTIFCDPDVSIRPGDRVAVRRKRADGTVYATYVGLAAVAGKPNVWENHQEFQLDMSGDA